MAVDVTICRHDANARKSCVPQPVGPFLRGNETLGQISPTWPCAPKDWTGENQSQWSKEQRKVAELRSFLDADLQSDRQWSSARDNHAQWPYQVATPVFDAPKKAKSSAIVETGVPAAKRSDATDDRPYRQQVRAVQLPWLLQPVGDRVRRSSVAHAVSGRWTRPWAAGGILKTSDQDVPKHIVDGCITVWSGHCPRVLQKRVDPRKFFSPRIEYRSWKPNTHGDATETWRDCPLSAPQEEGLERPTEFAEKTRVNRRVQTPSVSDWPSPEMHPFSACLGEVKKARKPLTTDLQPERDGLFCPPKFLAR
ncbi:hypothetical protein FQR65_LT20482 [Abscondita terminalis]|nr:hypothetical protein FQR65_LT20482 [Abscondita terminalis]